MVLFIVLAFFLVVMLIANLTMRFISSQSRLTHHSVSRIQAEYAAKAALLYAYDMLRRGTWVVTAAQPSRTYYLCRSASGCPGVASQQILDPSFPLSIHHVYINVTRADGVTCIPPAGSGSTACITARAEYAGSMD